MHGLVGREGAREHIWTQLIDRGEIFESIGLDLSGIFMTWAVDSTASRLINWFKLSAKQSKLNKTNESRKRNIEAPSEHN